MDAKIVHVVETEVPDVIGGSSGVDLDSTFRQVGDRDYENIVACEQPPLPVKLIVEGVNQGWEYEPVAEHLEQSQVDVRDVDANVEGVEQVQEQAAKTEVVELHEQQSVDQSLIPERMYSKAVPIVETEVPAVAVGGSSEADLNSGPSQIGDSEYKGHLAYEQLSLPVTSYVQEQEYEPGCSVAEHLEHRSTGDLHGIDTEMEDVKEVLEQAFDTEAVELTKEQVVVKELGSKKIANVVPIMGKVPDYATGGSLDLDSGPRQVEIREYGGHAVCDQQLSLPVKSLDKIADHCQEYEPGSLVAEYLAHKTTGNIHEAESKMEDVKDVQEQAAATEAVEVPKEQVDQKMVSEKMGAKVGPIVEKEVTDVSLEGSPNLDIGLDRAGDGEYRGHGADENSSMTIKSFDIGVGHGREYKPCSSVAEQLEHVTSYFHEVDTKMEDVMEMQDRAVYTEAAELLEEQEADQELVSGKTDAKVVPIVDKEVPDVSTRGTLDLDSGPRQADDRVNTDHTAYEQSPFPMNSIDKDLDDGWAYEPASSIAGHLEHRATGDIHEADTDMEDVNTVQEQAAIKEVVESPKEQVVDLVLVCEKVDVKTLPIVETEVSNVSNRGSSMADLDSGLTQVGYTEYGDNAAQEQSSLRVKSFVKDVHHGMGYEPGSPVAEHQEHRAIGDVYEFDRDMENDKEVQEQAASTEALELHEEQEVDQDLACKNKDAKVSSVMVTEAHDDYFRGSPAADLCSDPGHVEVREYGDHAAYGQPSLPVKSYVEGVDNGLEYKPGSVLAKHLEHGAIGEVHEVDTKMDDAQELQEQAANTEAIELPEEKELDLEMVSKRMDNGETELCDLYTESRPGVDMDSGLGQIEVREYGDHATCEPGSSAAEPMVYCATDDFNEVDTNIEDVEEVQDQAGMNEAVESPEEKDQELVPHSAKRRSKEVKNAKRASLKHGSLLKDHRVSYQLPLEDEGEFAVFDLVWGKVKSHPWWPGQIFHPSDSSEKAMKYYRKDCYLVAYFGDRTFAWNEASVLKPFKNHFSLAERQNNSEAFQNAVSCALEEVSRRVELGLACSCLPEEAYDKIKYQIVENTGIREESSRREGVDRSTGVDSFQPDKLTEYVRTLALFPASGVDRLELLVAKAQLLAFNRLKGCDALPEFQYYEGLVECDTDTPIEHSDSLAGVDAKKGPCKRKHNLKDIVYQRRKEKSMTELMGEYYLDGEFDSHEEDDNHLTTPTAITKRRSSGFLADDSTFQQSIKSISLAKVSHTTTSNPQQSFKVGECIRRVASQLTGSSVVIKGCSEGSNKHSGDDADEVSEPLDDAMTESTPLPSKKSSLDEMLSQLYLSARDPMKGYSFLGDIISFFSEFRNLAVTTQRQKMRKGAVRKRKSSVPVVGSPETFEFDDRNDSYWTDMVVQNNPEAKPVRRGRKRKDEQVVSGDPEKPLQPNRRKYTRKQYHNDNHESVPEMPAVDAKHFNLPTELMLTFGEMNTVLTEVNLNKMFRRFGPLKESETEVDMESCRARVVFKKRSDAEVAYSSAAMFNIFGSTLVNYQLNYTPSASFRNLPLALTDAKEDAT